MKRLKKFFKYKLKYFIAVILVLSLFLFGSLPSFASIFVDSSATQNSVAYGVPVEFIVIYLDSEDDHSYFYSSMLNFPITDPTKYGFNVALGPDYYDRTRFFQMSGLEQQNFDHSSASGFQPRFEFQYRIDNSYVNKITYETITPDPVRQTSKGYEGFQDYVFTIWSDTWQYYQELYPEDSQHVLRYDLYTNLIYFKVRDFTIFNDSDGVPCSEFIFLGVPQVSYDISVTYRLYGSLTSNTVTFRPSSDIPDEYDIAFKNGYIQITPELLGYSDPDTYIYIDEMLFYVYPNDYTTESLSSEAFLGDFHFVQYFYPDLQRKYDEAFIYNPRLDNPAVPLMSYTSWIGEAVSGFFDLEIFPFFTMGGIFMTILAFTLVVWFLKLIAGG